jgi:SMODS domain-containing protein
VNFVHRSNRRSWGCRPQPLTEILSRYVIQYGNDSQQTTGKDDMSVSQMFRNFCSNIVIGTALRSSIGYRVGRMVRCLNEDFRDSTSDTANSFYAGSYGRNTGIPSVSDIDTIFSLPWSTYTQYSAHLGNGQSALLQAMRASVRRTYPSSEVAADGQVIVVQFNDNIKVEILGAFHSSIDGSYTFPDSNNGGSWRKCKPKHELVAFSNKDSDCNGNLVQLGRMVRAWRDNNSVPMSGMLIDTLAYQFLASWAHREKSHAYYDWMVRDFFAYLGSLDASKNYWLAPGSSSYVWKTGSFQAKAKAAHSTSLVAIAHLDKDEFWSAKYEFRRIFGNAFPN